jgi:hypothetical protein
VITTARLRLRLWHDEDLEPFMTAVGNERSRRVMERVGMTREPVDDFDHPNIVPGHPLRRHVLYRLVARDWTHRKHHSPRGE